MIDVSYAFTSPHHSGSPRALGEPPPAHLLQVNAQPKHQPAPGVNPGPVLAIAGRNPFPGETQAFPGEVSGFPREAWADSLGRSSMVAVGTYSKLRNSAPKEISESWLA